MGECLQTKEARGPGAEEGWNYEQSNFSKTELENDTGPEILREPGIEGEAWRRERNVGALPTELGSSHIWHGMVQS